MKSYDVVGICNALVDILVEVEEGKLKDLQLQKGVMHLVDYQRQGKIFSRLNGAEQTIELGGSVLNAVRTMAALGAQTVFAGSIGGDQFGNRIRERMEELGIVPKLACHPHEATGTCLVLITPDGERTMITHLGASRLYDATLVPHDEIKKARIFHFSGYQWDTDGQKAAINEAVSTAKHNSTLVSFDVSDPFVVERHRSDFLRLIEDDADIVFANREEARLLYNEAPETVAKLIAETGAIAVLKLGSQGALIGRGNELIEVPAVPTKVVDTTAAGDMFAAGFLLALKQGCSLKDCGKAASYLASDVIQRIGATVSQQALRQTSAVWGV